MHSNTLRSLTRSNKTADKYHQSCKKEILLLFSLVAVGRLQLATTRMKDAQHHTSSTSVYPLKNLTLRVDSTTLIKLVHTFITCKLFPIGQFCGFSNTVALFSIRPTQRDVFPIFFTFLPPKWYFLLFLLTRESQ